MRKIFLPIRPIILVILAALMGSCTKPTTPPSPTSSSPPSSLPTPTTSLSSPTPLTKESSFTSVSIDGNDDDWENYPIAGTDLAGDQVAGSPDLFQIKAFNNDLYFYLLIQLAETGTTDHYDILMDINGGEFDYQLSVWPETNQANFAPFPVTNNMKPIGGVTTAQLDKTIEVKIPLDIIEDKPVLGSFIATFLGNKAGDQVENIQTSMLLELEPVPDAAAKFTPDSSKPEIDYTNLWGLTGNYSGEAILISAVGNNGGLTRSQGGTVYLKTWGSEAGVSLVDVETASVTRLFYIPPTSGMSDIIGGPEDTAFMNVIAEVWQIFPDGSHNIWGFFPDAKIVAYTKDGRMLGITHDSSTLLELHPDGSMETIASGFNGIADVAVMPDGVIVIYEWNTGDVVRLDLDGTRRTLVPHVMPLDFANLGLDFDGQLYLNSAGTYGFKRLDVDTGTLTDIPSAYSPCIWNPNDFVFIEPGKILLTGDQLTWADIQSGENDLFIQNIASTFAAAIGPDQALYIGVSGCEDQIAGRILRIADDGSQSVYLDNLDGMIWQMVFSPEGDLFLATASHGSNHLLLFTDGKTSPVEIPGAPPERIMAMAYHPQTGNLWLSRQRGAPLLEFNTSGLVRSHPVTLPGDSHEFRIAFSPDGALYGYEGRTEGPTEGPWVVSIDPDTGKSTIITEIPRKPGGGGLGAFTVDSEGNLWVILNPESILYQIKPDGKMTSMANNLPIDVPAIAINDAGDIYFTGSSGIFGIFREP